MIIIKLFGDDSFSYAFMFFTVLRYTPLGGGVLDSPILISPYPRSPALCCQDTSYTWRPAYCAPFCGELPRTIVYPLAG